MLQFISICSGSSGNCYYLLQDGYGLLIDLGIGIRKFKQHFSNYGLPLAQIQAILVTHDHTDHVKGVPVLARDFRLPVYTSELVHTSMMRNHYLSKKVPLNQQHNFERGDGPLQLGPFEVSSFAVPHDSADNNGYVVRTEENCIVVMTDIGHFTPEMEAVVGEATHLIIESNYDEEMLAHSRYPLYLQRRISGDRGHISNRETGDFLARHLNRDRIRQVWLCHLSAENNQPAKALATVTAALEAAGYTIGVPGGLKVDPLPRHTPTLLQTL